METYVATDVESDGPIPGPHSMLSLGSAAVSAEGAPLGSFSANLLPLDCASPHPDTEAWWATQPEARAATEMDPRPAPEVMRSYVQWLETLPGTPVFVGYPAGFDFLFVYWYLVRFTGTSPFGLRAVDGHTFAMAALDLPWSQTGRADLPGDLQAQARHTHVAVDDAFELAEVFLKLRTYNSQIRR